MWGFAFRWLLLEFREKANLAEKEEKKLIKDLEARLKRVYGDLYSAEHAISLLAEYYASQKDQENLMRVLNLLEQAFKKDVRSNSEALLKTHAYERIQEIYQKYASQFPEAEIANKRLLKEIGELDLDWETSLKKVSVETSISRKEIDSFIASIFGGKKQDSLDKVMARIALAFLPKKDRIKDQFKDHSRDHVIQFLCTTQIISDDGIPVAKLLGLEEHYDQHFQRYASQNMQFGSGLLQIAIDELKKRFTEEEITNYFKESSLFKDENPKYLKRAVSGYLKEDYLLASHLFNPIIETAIRELVKLSGGIILRPNNIGGYDRVLLGGLLKNEEIFSGVFSEVGHNILFYFRLVLTERLGMNLRNDFAHGFGKEKFFERSASDQLFHILIWLSLVKKKEDS